MDFRTAVIESLDKVIASGAIEAAIEKSIAKTVINIVESELLDYGDFGKQITASVKSSLKFDDRMGLPGYNDLILKIIRKKVDAQIGSTIGKQIASQMTELLQTPPAEIKVSDLIELFREYAEGHRGDGDRFTVGYERGTVPGYWSLWFDTGKNVKQYQSQFQISMTEEGEVYHFTIGGRKVEDMLFVGRLYAFERSLFQIYAGGTTIVLDCEPGEIETYYSEKECHC